MFKYLVKLGANSAKGNYINNLKIFKNNFSIISNINYSDRKNNIMIKHFSNVINQDQQLEEEVIDNL